MVYVRSTLHLSIYEWKKVNKAKSTLPFPCIFSLTGRKKRLRERLLVKYMFISISGRNSTIPCFVCVQLESPGNPFRVFRSKDETPLLGR
jgi:hypothetical protein